MNEYRLEMRGVCKSFPGVKALDHAQLCLRPGKVHALMGENGAGKSTLMKCMFGIYSMDEGEVIYEGQKVSIKDPLEALHSKNVPDPELIIRPSGELRTSNFLLWQSAYSEYVFMNVLWPDFAPEHLDEAIAEYHRRNRRFGGV